MAGYPENAYLSTYTLYAYLGPNTLINTKTMCVIPFYSYSRGSPSKQLTNEGIKTVESLVSRMITKKGIRQYSTYSSISYQNLSLIVWEPNFRSTVSCTHRLEGLSEVNSLSPHEMSVIIGLILSDACLTKSTRSKNVLLKFAQSISHSAYVWYVFNILSHYCKSGPKEITSIVGGKRFSALQFRTRSMTAFTELYYLFYHDKIKVIPLNIYELLTPIALAHLIQGDGGVIRYGLVICTDCFSVQDVVRLMNVIMVRYRLYCTLQKSKKIQYRIYITEGSMPLLRHIVTPHFCPSMLYKLRETLTEPKSSLGKESSKRLIEINKLKGKRVEVLDIKNNKTTVYCSISDAARAIDCINLTVFRALKTCNDEGISRLIKQRFRIKYLEKYKSIGQIVEILDIINNKTTIYSSVSEAARAFSCHKNTIWAALKECNEKEKGASKLIKKRYSVKLLKC